MAGYVSEAVIRRLPGYYRHLCELEAMGVKQISSQEMGRQMHLIPSQIRQDINCFGGFGRKGYGYNVTSLRQHIGEILGLDHPHSVIIIGAGSIGSALAHYPDFHGETFDTKALFDIDPTRVGTNIGGVPVYSMEELDSYLASHAVDIAVLCVPKEAAQEILNRLEAGGVTAVWNFAPLDLQHETDRMLVENVHLSDSLRVLSYRMAHQDGDAPKE